MTNRIAQPAERNATGSKNTKANATALIADAAGTATMRMTKMIRTTFECESGFRGDAPVKFVFHREGCLEKVTFHAPDLSTETVTLDEFCKIMRRERLRRERSAKHG